eukprot:Nitzschia sp. Nitz4//scaffold68_size99682//58511//59485//NITZ4_004570-RA/size99682-processed-gene-0.44-mRNA-1//-1//CDS//3329556611//472//frame0
MKLSNAILLLASYVSVASADDVIEAPDPTDPCTVCYDESDPSTVTNTVYQTTVTCSEIISNVSASDLLQGDEQCEQYQLWGYQLGCCPTPPYQTCDICPDGSEYTRLNEIPTATEVGGDPTCAEFELYATNYNAFFTPGTCDDTYVRRVAHYCGCPNTEQECTLCSDGQAASNPERGDNFFFNGRCEGIEYFFSLFTADECTGAREAYGIDYENFCRCPDYVKPEDDGQCLMCSGGIKNPDFVFTDETDTYDRTCQQAQDFADSIIRENTCLSIMADAIERGCECRSGEPVFLADGESPAGMKTFTLTLSGLAVMGALFVMELF